MCHNPPSLAPRLLEEEAGLKKRKREEEEEEEEDEDVSLAVPS